jgi:hypothetical protein
MMYPTKIYFPGCLIGALKDMADYEGVAVGEVVRCLIKEALRARYGDRQLPASSRSDRKKLSAMMPLKEDECPF